MKIYTSVVGINIIITEGRMLARPKEKEELDVLFGHGGQVIV